MSTSDDIPDIEATAEGEVRKKESNSTNEYIPKAVLHIPGEG